MRLNPLLVAVVAMSTTMVSSCASTRTATRLLDWDQSLIRGPIRLAFVSSPMALNEIDEIEVYSTEVHIQVYPRIADTAGNLFLLPKGMKAEWTLMGSDDQDPFYLEGFDENTARSNSLQIVSLRKGYVEGRNLYLIPSHPRVDVSYGLRVAVRFSERLVLDDFIPIRLRLSPSP